MNKLTGRGVLVMTSEAPVLYALAETAPAPTADVRAYMTQPLTDGEPATGTDAGTTGTDAGTADTTEDATTTAPADEAPADDATATDDDETGTPATDEAPAAPIAA